MNIVTFCGWQCALLDTVTMHEKRKMASVGFKYKSKLNPKGKASKLFSTETANLILTCTRHSNTTGLFHTLVSKMDKHHYR